jgi:hypothetical protein
MTFSPAARLQCLRRQERPVKGKNTGASKRPASSAPSCLILSFRTVFGKLAFALATRAGQPQTCSGSRAGCALEYRRHAHPCKERGAMMRAHRCSVLDVGRSALSVGRFPSGGADELHLVPQPLLVPMRPHAFAALVLGNFCFPSFFKRAHSVFQSRKVRFNHLIHRVATRFLRLLCNHDHALPQKR